MNKFGIILIIIFLIYYVLKNVLKYKSELKKDDTLLENTDLESLLNPLLKKLNEYSFNGKGSLTFHNRKSFDLYDNESNQIIFFQLNTGRIYITWKYKYYQQEMIYKRTLYDLKDATEEGQKESAELIINEFEIKLQKHKNRVNN